MTLNLATVLKTIATVLKTMVLKVATVLFSVFESCHGFRNGFGIYGCHGFGFESKTMARLSFPIRVKTISMASLPLSGSMVSDFTSRFRTLLFLMSLSCFVSILVSYLEVD